MGGDLGELPAQKAQVGLGPRALAVDERNNLLLALDQGNGKITLIDLTDNRVIGSIDLTA